MGHPRPATGTAMRALGVLLCVPLAAWGANDYPRRVGQGQVRTPLVDGHNDLPWEVRDRFKGDLTAVDFRSDTAHLPLRDGQSPLMTDIPRLRAGHVGGQFWSVWIPTGTKGFEAVQPTLNKMDLAKGMGPAY